MVKVLPGRALINPLDESISQGGIMLQKETNEKIPIKGVIHTISENDLGLEVGDKVLIERFKSRSVVIDDVKLLNISVNNIIAKVDE